MKFFLVATVFTVLVSHTFIIFKTYNLYQKNNSSRERCNNIVITLILFHERYLFQHFNCFCGINILIVLGGSRRLPKTRGTEYCEASILILIK